MKALSQSVPLIKRAYWLINLRWIAIFFVCAGTFFSSKILVISLQDVILYSIAGLLLVYNTVVLFLLNYYIKKNHVIRRPAVRGVINFQISADLLILTFLIHFSGGIENPFVFYFIFHMIISSILLSVKESYLQATFAVLLFGLMLLLEYKGPILHHCLEGFISNCHQQGGRYIIGFYFAFTTAMYLVVYMANYISTRLKKAEQAHRGANVLLCKKDRIKDEYVLRLTHDIKGHLAAIQSCLDVVNRKLVGPLNTEQADFVKRATERTRKVTNFVKALLRLTRIRLDSKITMEYFSLKDTINSVIDSARRRAQKGSLSLSCNIEPSVDKIYGSQLSIEEMIMNLLLNAIKYTPENGKVSLTATSTDHSVLVEIIDTGIGIPKDELCHVFEEFYRGSNARKIEKDGTGLGLSIASQIVERHDGKIGVESEEGKGTRLWFTLPKDERVSHDSSVETIPEEFEY